MNVFLPFKKDANPVLDEIEHCFDGNFIYDHYKNYGNYDVDVVHIHWPESIFNFSEPTLEELSELEIELKKWSKESLIVYTRHNAVPHKNSSGSNFTQLYALILKYCHGIIHLGNYSQTELEKRHPSLKDLPAEIIPHPAYTLFDNTISRNEARKILGISNDKKVILVFGSIRNESELNLILTSFKKLNVAKKHLLISNLNIYRPIPSSIIGKIRKRIKTKIERLALSLENNITVGYDFVSNEDVQLYLNAADVLLIPRITLLNSGNLYLGFSFKKIVVGPEIGNIKEWLAITNNPSYDPLNIDSLTEALNKGLSLSSNKGEENFNFVIENSHPLKIAQQYLNFYKKLKVKK